MSMVRNVPTPEGRLLGEQLARFADVAEPEMLRRFPGQDARCPSCAFRRGTLPNGCPETVMDALKCVIEVRPFLCHQVPAGTEPSELCAGWCALVNETTVPGKAPWPLSNQVKP